MAKGALAPTISNAGPLSTVTMIIQMNPKKFSRPIIAPLISRGIDL